MKKIILVTEGIFHPHWLGRKVLHRTLKQLPGFSFDHLSSLEKLPAEMSPYSALVLHYHQKDISKAALEKLDQFVQNGGGILALHGATASFKETHPYFKILGGRFIWHDPVGTFVVKRRYDSIFSTIEDFIIKDELYIHELEPGIKVHFTSKFEGKDIPVVWIHHYGKGRVCYAVPGHTTKTMRHPTYQRLLQQGLLWVTE